MQELGVVPRLFPLVVAGQKTSTIRWRETTIVPGYMRYVCDGDATSTAIVWVTRCTEMPLSKAAAFVGRQSEWPKDVMLSGMREHYAEIEWTDIVQIVEHLTPADSMRLSNYPAATP